MPVLKVLVGQDNLMAGRRWNLMRWAYSPETGWRGHHHEDHERAQRCRSVREVPSEGWDCSDARVVRKEVRDYSTAHSWTLAAYSCLDREELGSCQSQAEGVLKLALGSRGCCVIDPQAGRCVAPQVPSFPHSATSRVAVRRRMAVGHLELGARLADGTQTDLGVRLVD